MEDILQVKKNSDVLEAMRGFLMTCVKNSRYQHILRVEDEIVKLGEIFLPDKLYELRVSAILHDITKDISLQQQLQLCKKFGIMYCDSKSKEILHSKTGAYYAREKFSLCVTDEIFNAIKNHTTGCADMSLFDKLLFVADYIESGRTYKKCISVREKLWKGLDTVASDQREKLLDEVCIEILDNTILFLVNEKKTIYEETITARNSLLCKILHEGLE